MSEQTPEQYDPADHNVDEVNEHLATVEDPAERDRILQAERDGKARSTILDAHTPAEGDNDPEGDPTPEETAQTREGDRQAPQTRGQTFQEAAEAATPDERGYLGYSPAREAAGGKADKGLSQQSILKG